ncbi:MAG TPA: peptide-methionine (S)-S-oxide reductase MsrA [Saprospiraceae bacterium]|nr:peptide-methionine (S)-S-oxide reductase MsrA [Saprospiraceae bacterium]
MMNFSKLILILIYSLFLLDSSQAQEITTPQPVNQSFPNNMNTEIATFGAGCFWCVEAVFQELKGVLKVESGYMGGKTSNPSYREVCSGTTGHAEVTKITFDPSVISFEELLEVLWTTHDPTTLNRQGADAGTQYRSVIFYQNDGQKEKAEKSKAEVAPTLWDNTIVTQIVPAETFYPAEEYHQDYYANNSNAAYCQIVINPKIAKVRTKFKSKLKEQKAN